MADTALRNSVNAPEGVEASAKQSPIVTVRNLAKHFRRESGVVLKVFAMEASASPLRTVWYHSRRPS